ncbi:MAG: GNAT family N-acetyltransferase [Bacteroidia bacterium]|nr:GNAT family N-acetyltransferase [Bacteroidia bacterium]
MERLPLAVREITLEDIPDLLGYWFNAPAPYLESMGVDTGKMPLKDEFRSMLLSQLQAPYEEKKSYALIWLLEGKAVGHSNINTIAFGEQAHMHLHLWEMNHRRRGLGPSFIRLSLPWYFRNYRLKRILCEPYARNAAPSLALERAGFTFVKEYITVPGFINFEQPVKQWEMTYERFLEMESDPLR